MNEAALADKQAKAGTIVADITAAIAKEEASKIAYDDAAAAKSAMEADCAAKAATYAEENTRRSNELADVEACLTLFENELLGENTSAYTKARAESVSDANEVDYEVHDITHDRSEYTETGGFDQAGEL